MFKKFIWMTSFVVIILSLAVCLSSCQAPKQNAAEPNTLVTEYPEETAVQTPPDNAQEKAISMYVDAMMLNELNEREQAIRKLNQALELDPTFSMAYSLKGDILQKMEKYEDSADAYEQATNYDPWSFKDFFNLGKVCQVIQQWARAVKAYVSACKLDPQHYPAHMGAAQCYYELKDYDNSLTYAEKAQELDPNQADPELLMGEVFEAQKDHIQAINAFRRALELQGNDPNIMVSLARAYLRAGRYSAAKELLTDVVSKDPKNSMAYQYLGFAQLRLKEIAEAVKSYQQAVEVDENDWMARKGLGVAYMMMAIKNQNDEKMRALAVEQWNISLQIQPDQPKLREWVKRYQ